MARNYENLLKKELNKLYKITEQMDLHRVDRAEFTISDFNRYVKLTERLEAVLNDIGTKINEAKNGR